jgi:hypothetical protein
MYQAKHWHQVMPVSTILSGFYIWHNFGGLDGAFTCIALSAAGLLHGYYLAAAGKIWQEYEAHGGKPAENSFAPVPEIQNGFTPLRINTYQSTVDQVKERDPRLAQWAYAVAYNGTSMIQTKWAGRKRLFSKPEYVRWTGELLKREIIVPINPRSGSSTYKPNGAAGWQQIKDIADMRTYIPLPAATFTEKDTHFLRARMREASAVGEGLD